MMNFGALIRLIESWKKNIGLYQPRDLHLLISEDKSEDQTACQFYVKFNSV